MTAHAAQPNFAMFERGPDMMMVVQNLEPLPYNVGSKNCLFRVVFRRHITANIFEQKRATNGKQSLNHEGPLQVFSKFGDLWPLNGKTNCIYRVAQKSENTQRFVYSKPCVAQKRSKRSLTSCTRFRTSH